MGETGQWWLGMVRICSVKEGGSVGRFQVCRVAAGRGSGKSERWFKLGGNERLGDLKCFLNGDGVDEL